MNISKIYIGTSGWSYQDWVGPFYPEDLQNKDFLSYYNHYFSTVEINCSFYYLPNEKTILHWAEKVPEGFIFSVKANRYLTHMKKLKNSLEALDRFMNAVLSLAVHLGPILFQLPPRWKSNPQRLESFLKNLPTGNRYVFEFRDPSWWNETVYHLLKINRISFCIFDLERVLSPIVLTTDFVYIRLHGPNDAYRGLYSDEALQNWAKKIEEWRNQNKTIYCYFDNDQLGFSVRNALKLKKILNDIFKNEPI